MTVQLRFAGRPTLLLAVLALLLAPAARALGPENLLLIVNKNVPEGRKLAETYAQLRHVPDGRILALDLPSTDEVSFEQYERDIVPPILRYLRGHDLDHTVTCLVTFYGVPLKIAPHKLSPEESREVADLNRRAQQINHQLEPPIAQMERLAAEIDPTFRAATPPADEPDALARRAQTASQFIALQLARMNDRDRRAQFGNRFIEIQKQIIAAGALPITPAESATAPASTQALVEQIQSLIERRFDPQARRDLLKLAQQQDGVFGVLRLISGEVGYLSTEATDAAVDNELALLQWSFYERSKWQYNPLCYRFADEGRTPPVMMVMRLDAPTPQQVGQIIAQSIEVEAKGLTGTIAIDARGLHATKPRGGGVDPYGLFDQKLRDLAELARRDTKLTVDLDDKPALMPANSVNNVALYCGWYSPGQYVPSVKLVPGAVAVHIASYEMTSLHNENAGWCRGLINAGAAATLGPVSEPYLHAFPNPDDFFPLLLTGKLTLAEVYWRSEPLASWKMTAVGDPLYTPFKQNPQLTVDQLPERLRTILRN